MMISKCSPPLRLVLSFSALRAPASDSDPNLSFLASMLPSSSDATGPGITALFGTRVVDGMTDVLDAAGAGEDRDDISIGDNEDNADVGRLVCGEPEEESC